MKKKLTEVMAIADELGLNYTVNKEDILFSITPPLELETIFSKAAFVIDCSEELDTEDRKLVVFTRCLIHHLDFNLPSAAKILAALMDVNFHMKEMLVAVDRADGEIIVKCFGSLPAPTTTLKNKTVWMQINIMMLTLFTDIIISKIITTGLSNKEIPPFSFYSEEFFKAVQELPKVLDKAKTMVAAREFLESLLER